MGIQPEFYHPIIGAPVVFMDIYGRAYYGVCTSAYHDAWGVRSYDIEVDCLRGIRSVLARNLWRPSCTLPNG